MKISDSTFKFNCEYAQKKLDKCLAKLEDTKLLLEDIDVPETNVEYLQDYIGNTQHFLHEILEVITEKTEEHE